MKELDYTALEKYRKFHNDDPDHVDERPRAWVPGRVKLLGPAIDIGYVRATENTSKDARYVHTFKGGVVCLERASRGGEDILTVPEYPFATFPQKLMVLGYCLGYTFDNNGEKKEVEAPVSWRLCTDFNTGRILVVVDGKGVKHVFCGGGMYVKDWIYN